MPREPRSGPSSPREEAAFALPIAVTIIEGGRERVVEYDGSRPLTIGRSDDCGIVLTTSRASRVHAEIIGEGGRFTLIDPGSSNGTRIAGEKIAQHPLRPGDVIEIGDARIVFGAVSQATAPADGGAGADDGADDGADAGADHGADADAAPARGARRELPAPVRPGPFAIVDALLGVLLILLIGLLVREYASDPPPAHLPAGGSGHASVPPGTEGVPNGSLGAESSATLATAAPGDPAIDLDDGLVARDALDSLRIIEQRIETGESRYDALEDLELLISTYPGTPAEDRARHLALVLEGLRRSEQVVRRQQAERALSPLVREERYGEALAVVRFLARLEGPEEDRARWVERSAELERVAALRLRGLEEELTELLRAGLGGDALRSLAGVRGRFSGTAAFEEALPRYLDAALGAAPAYARGVAAPAELIELDAQATRAFAECRYADLVPILHRSLGLELPADERVRLLEELVEAHYLQAMWLGFVERIAGGGVVIEMARGEKARIVRADEREIAIERALQGGTYEDVRPWARVMPAERTAIFAAVQHERDGLLGLAFLARRAGDPESFDRALLLLHRKSASRPFAEAVLARHRGESIPAEGYVEHLGRLMTAAEKDAELARARALRDQEKEALAQLRRLEKAERVTEVLEWVRLLRAQSSFTLADKVLAEVVAKTDETMGAEARRLREDPLLHSVSIRASGPAERRIDFFILGDGYLVDDEYQQAFLNAANTCEKLLFSVDPYREYQAYFNVTALHLQSKEAGADKIPGDVVKDTACDAKITWQRLTCDPERVFGFLRRFPEAMAQDHQGIVIVNDYADVATGGGGVATISKAGLTVVQHEVGHAFGGLLDEYDYTPGTDPQRPIPKGRLGNVPTRELRPNLMEGSDREEVLAHTYWKNWIDAGETRWWNLSKVSVFEGGNHTPFEVWRPQMGCMMRDGSGFCVVCMETMVKQIYRRVRPIDRLDPEPGAVTLEAGEDRIFQVFPMQPRTHDLEAVWRLVSLGVNTPAELAAGDGAGQGNTSVPESEGEVYGRTARRTDPEGRTIHGAEMRAKDLAPGWYRLKVEVRDPTPWVLEDAEGLLVDRAHWLVEVKAKED